MEELQKRKQSDVLRFVMRIRAWQFRQEVGVLRCTHPTRPDKARRLGYKAKQGYVIYRVRVRRGGRKRPNHRGIVWGKPKHQGVNHLKRAQNLRGLAEQKVGRVCGNLRVLSSYWVNQDATFKWYEVILVDPNHKTIRRDPRINWIVSSKHKHREMRGLTTAGRKARGLKTKGHLFHKNRPSVYANWKRRQLVRMRRYR
eukprot:TRINITY_DN3723_c0_g1_i1.p1 TRINITY_DN3723_c0_g1~~TRINITY_DN3723_c0_g1_i1.p1  ORF type:complete len:199 (-),score=45.48 TRINITY_DN3723_c0_g1_i1:96-692(-)